MAYRSILMIALLVGGAASAAPALAEKTDIPEGYIRVAASHGIPPEALYSVSLTETSMAPGSIASIMSKKGKKAGVPSVMRPWPWTINVAGKGYRYSSRLEAWQALQVFMKSYPLKRIDVGLVQVNLGWNGHHFASTWDAFDPYTNLNAAATILHECWERNPGSWLNAAGCYHHPAGGQAADRYKGIVKRHLARLNTTSPPVSVSQPVAAPQAVAVLTPEPGFVWTEPGK
ncbi:TPA: transglycosylase SLT domain-containing protein [Kluyvera cryocrescens]|nr:transglycosylase SLT domain-containing protein [Kluyvera cryocrescens]